MRRFEPRSKHAPMDFTYDSQKPRGVTISSPYEDQKTRGGSPFHFGGPQNGHTTFTSPSTASSSTFSASFGQSSAFNPRPSGSPSANAPIPPFSFSQTPTTWTPPRGFTPDRAFPSQASQPSSAPDTDMGDLSMSTAGSITPEPSPSRLSRRERAGSSAALEASGSPLRKATFKTRDRDRSRERERVLERRRGLSRPRDDENEGQNGVVSTRGNGDHQYHFHLPAAKVSHGDLPYILSSYVQFFFNLSLLLLFLYLLVVVVNTIRIDVDHKVAEYSANAMRERTQCTSAYIVNKCAPETRIPLMETTCRQLEECMEQDPSAVGRTKVAAEIFAQVANSFMENISWRTMAFSLTSLALFVFFVNASLSLYRSRHAPVYAPHSHTPLGTPQFPNPQIPWGAPPWSVGAPLAVPDVSRREKTPSLLMPPDDSS
ncbi:hypothetical protein DL93DRAFT_2070953 [Clavulina sp. PMI_390]|nr:hypothetical protein DL93DRAFT_2070953 [Clavulina sp. PMI_390]